MMLQRELIRIVTAFLLGAVVGLFIVCSSGSVSLGAVLLLGLHGISVLYSARFCWDLMKKIYVVYFQYSLMGFWMGASILKTLVMGLVISLLLSLLLTVGCIFGWVRCVYCIVVAVKTDRMYF